MYLFYLILGNNKYFKNSIFILHIHLRNNGVMLILSSHVTDSWTQI